MEPKDFRIAELLDEHSPNIYQDCVRALQSALHYEIQVADSSDLRDPDAERRIGALGTRLTTMETQLYALAYVRCTNPDPALEQKILDAIFDGLDAFRTPCEALGIPLPDGPLLRDAPAQQRLIDLIDHAAGRSASSIDAPSDDDFTIPEYHTPGAQVQEREGAGKLAAFKERWIG